jgi:hypothetical protein
LGLYSLNDEEKDLEKVITVYSALWETLRLRDAARLSDSPDGPLPPAPPSNGFFDVPKLAKEEVFFFSVSSSN